MENDLVIAISKRLYELFGSDYKIDIDEKKMDSEIDDITKMYSTGAEKINAENLFYLTSR